MIGTIARLFEAAGYKDYKSLPRNEFVKPKRNVGIYSFENGKKVLKKVNALIYKGEARKGYKVISSKGIFLATPIHKIYDAENNKYVELKDAYKYDKFFGLNSDGQKELVHIEKCNEPFSVLDLEVEGTHTYFSAGILSHNTFGGTAKALKEFCNRFVPLASEYNTTFFIISQERAQMALMSHAIQTTGGYALKYAASTSMRTRKIENLTEGSKITGIHMQVRNYKNKTGIPFRECEMDLYYKGGFDSATEYIDFLKDFNEDSRLKPLCYAGNGGVYKSEKFGWSYRGKDNFVEAVKNGLEGWDEIKAAVESIITNEIEGKENTGDPEQLEEQNLTKENAESLEEAEE